MSEGWSTLKLTNNTDRETVALALFRAGYIVKTRKAKDGNKSVIVLDYRKGENQ